MLDDKYNGRLVAHDFQQTNIQKQLFAPVINFVTVKSCIVYYCKMLRMHFYTVILIL